MTIYKILVFLSFFMMCGDTNDLSDKGFAIWLMWEFVWAVVLSISIYKIEKEEKHD